MENINKSICQGCQEGTPIVNGNEHYSFDGLPYMYCEAIVKLKIVNNINERIEILPRYAKEHSIRFENGVYTLAREWDKDYSGGFWEYVDLGDCFFMFPRDDERQYIANTCYDTEKVNNITFGIAASLMITNQMSWYLADKSSVTKRYHADSRHFADMFYILKDRMCDEEWETQWKDFGVDIGKVLRILD